MIPIDVKYVVLPLSIIYEPKGRSRFLAGTGISSSCNFQVLPSACLLTLPCRSHDLRFNGAFYVIFEVIYTYMLLRFLFFNVKDCGCFTLSCCTWNYLHLVQEAKKINYVFVLLFKVSFSRLKE